MARTSEDHNITRQAEFNAEGQANKSYGNAEGDIGAFNRNVATLDRGGQVAANPW